jgi:hypothetical protein
VALNLIHSKKVPFDKRQITLRGFSRPLDYAPIVQIAATFFENILLASDPDLPTRSKQQSAVKSAK